METVTKVNTKFVRLLQPGTTLTAIDDDNKRVRGTVGPYRFAQHVYSDNSTSYEIEYLVRWSDGLYEWISWSEVDTYSPVRPKRPVPHRPHIEPRAHIRSA